MFEFNHYVPMLKLKMGEIRALSELEAERKKHLTPFFEITPIPWDYEEDAYAKSLEDHVAKVPANLKKCWDSSPLFLDFKYVEEELAASTGPCPMLNVFTESYDAGINPIPVIGLSRSEGYKQRVKAVAQAGGKGLCVRLEGDDFDSDTYGNVLLDLITTLGLRVQDTDLLIDLGQIPDSGLSPFVVGMKNIIRFLPNLDDWRTLTFSASAFPDSLSKFDALTAHEIPRAEWELWNRVIDGTLRRKPAFGDYGITAPPPFEMDPRMMRLGAKVKYTLADTWLIVKGQGISRGGYKQFHALSTHIIKQPGYYGSDFSWGDNYINECAKKACSTGNQTTWVTVGMNHHFAVVAEQIAVLAAP